MHVYRHVPSIFCTSVVSVSVVSGLHLFPPYTLLSDSNRASSAININYRSHVSEYIVYATPYRFSIYMFACSQRSKGSKNCLHKAYRGRLRSTSRRYTRTWACQGRRIADQDVVRGTFVCRAVPGRLVLAALAGGAHAVLALVSGLG